EKTYALHHFAHRFLGLYAARKAASGLLDFEDLISRAGRLLSAREMADWVLFRLDGGIDQILVDEAQDTSPAQWRVIEALAAEFTAGYGARGTERRIFVVGDAKQSIYSFQGAELAIFGEKERGFHERHQLAGMPFQSLELQHSFRSSSAILRVVDACFTRPGSGVGAPPSHIPFWADLPGRVDLWEPIEPAEKEAEKEWYEAVDELPPAHHTLVLADKIAHTIREMIARGTQIPDRDGPRRMHEGDVLILLYSRSELFHAIIRACKQQGLAVAGADRLVLTKELAVKDILALLAFLATPEDDLSLATALRSPLFGWSEAQLFDLAHNRPKGGFLWAALREKTAEHAATLAVLNDLRDQADFLRPYELIERLLTRHGRRARLIARLGAEIEDAIDLLLSTALGYEQGAIPSLTGFLSWVVQGEITIKRSLESGQKAIRVMTIHGAKGLEAPVVFLPQTIKRPLNSKDIMLRSEAGNALWKGRKPENSPQVQAARAEKEAKEIFERDRLLYVAMTRAEHWLIVAAAGDVGKEVDDSWYNKVAAGMSHVGAVNGRYSHGDWPEDLGPEATTEGETASEPPAWLSTPLAWRPRPQPPLSPSDLGGAKALPGEEGLPEEEARQRGTLLHLLLEHLPKHPEADWPRLARALSNADWPEIEPLFFEAKAVLTAPELAQLFSPGSLAEVELTARPPQFEGRSLRGTIDRLVVTADRVLAVDYKSNAVVPASPEEVPLGILRQMGAYAAMLEEIYPDRRIDLAIVWTKTARLMPIDLNIVRMHWPRLHSLDDGACET
ncbi:MAG: UvrD-helicase domain-containing protein, partial [Paracoccaceae bacterium]